MKSLPQQKFLTHPRAMLRPFGRVGSACFLGMLLGAPTAAHSQEAIRHSIASSATVAVANASNPIQRPNLRIGPVGLRATAGVEFEYNDNVTLSEKDREGDFIIRPRVNLSAAWQVTRQNVLTLDLGLGYAFYMDHSELNSDALLISPQSALQFNVYIRNFRINFHDRFSVQQDPVDQASLSNVAKFGRFENTAGVQVDWDLNTMIFSFGYDHYNFVALDSEFDYLDRNAEIVSGRAAFGITPTISTGLETAAAFSHYRRDILADNTNFQIGAFVSVVVTSYLRFQLAGGYEAFYFDDTNRFDGRVGDENGYYVRFLAVNRLNAYVTQALSVGHNTQLGYSSNTLETTYARYSAELKLIRNVGLAFDATYEHGKESGGFLNESYDHYGASLNLNYRLTPSITTTLGYTFFDKESNVALRDYYQNRVVLTFNYSF
jgi:Putative beta-barrel porin 2